MPISSAFSSKGSNFYIGKDIQGLSEFEMVTLEGGENIMRKHEAPSTPLQLSPPDTLTKCKYHDITIP